MNERVNERTNERISFSSTNLNLKSSPSVSTDFGLISNIPDQLYGCPPNAYST